VLSAFVLTAGAVGAYLAATTLRDRVVHEQVITAIPDGAIDLGGLKGNREDQQYVIPANADTAGRTVVIWCRAFGAPFGSAILDRVA
jgi:hypothetical protein